jgi:hypothetical protein
MRKFIPHVLASLGVATLFAPTASAHIKLIDPPARYAVADGSDVGIKSCPCGLGGSNRVCNVAQDGSDPDRSARVTRYEAGSTVTLRFEEFVNHSGRFRVAFDPDGADVADFNANILADMPDPANASGMIWEIPVTLPDMTCTNCTIQLVQAMEVPMDVAIADPSPISSYYNCVDVELVPKGTLGQDQPGDDGSGQTPPPDNTGEQTGDNGATDPADDGSDDGAAGTGTTPAAMNGGSSSANSGNNNSGNNNSGNNMGTPSSTLIPVGMMPGMDSSSGTATGTGTGMVAMNDPGAVVTGGGLAGVAPPMLPTSSSDNSGGCSMAPSGQRDGAFGMAALGVLAFIGLGRRTKRAS